MWLDSSLQKCCPSVITSYVGEGRDRATAVPTTIVYLFLRVASAAAGCRYFTKSSKLSGGSQYVELEAHPLLNPRKDAHKPFQCRPQPSERPRTHTRVNKKRRTLLLPTMKSQWDARSCLRSKSRMTQKGNSLASRRRSFGLRTLSL